MHSYNCTNGTKASIRMSIIINTEFSLTIYQHKLSNFLLQNLGPVFLSMMKRHSFLKLKEKTATFGKKTNLGSRMWVSLHRLPKTRTKGSVSISKALEMWKISCYIVPIGIWSIHFSLKIVLKTPLHKLTNPCRSSLNHRNKKLHTQKYSQNTSCFRVDCTGVYQAGY